jgi:phosphoribosylformylglycinamidine cyclo-ligase
MWRTFNCGVGLVICVAADKAERAQLILREAGETVWPLGHVTTSTGEPFVEFQP